MRFNDTLIHEYHRLQRSHIKVIVTQLICETLRASTTLVLFFTQINSTDLLTTHIREAATDEKHKSYDPLFILFIYSNIVNY